jgi:flagellar hook-associated protein 3 FlgL
MYRITQVMTSNDVLTNIMANLNKMNKYQYQLSSGNKIKYASDDPVVATRLSTYQNKLGEIDQFLKNISETKGYLDIAENNVKDMKTYLDRVRELTLQISNGTYTQNDREAAKNEIEQIEQHLKQLANTRYEGRYIFSGTQSGDAPLANTNDIRYNVTPDIGVLKFKGKTISEVDEGMKEKYTVSFRDVFERGARTISSKDFSPYDNLSGTDDPEVGTIVINDSRIGKEVSFDYRFDSKTKIQDILNQLNEKAKTADGVGLIHFYMSGNKIVAEKVISNETQNFDDPTPVNMDSSSISIQDSGHLIEDLGLKDGKTINGVDIFGVLENIKSHIDHNDADKLGGVDLTNLDTLISNSISVRSTIGAMSKSLMMGQQRLQGNKITITQMQSQDADVDVSETMIKFSQESAAYNAALVAGAKVIMPTLVNFLK